MGTQFPAEASQGKHPDRPLTRKIFLLGAGYAVVGWAGLQLTDPTGYAPLIWPASGVAVGTLVLHGNRLAVGILLGAFIVALLRGLSLAPGSPVPLLALMALVVASGAALQAAGVAAIATRRFGRPLRLDNTWQLAQFAAVTGPLGSVVAPTVGMLALWNMGVLPKGSPGATWFTWWIGDTLGVLLFMPILFVSPWRPWAPRIEDMPVAALRKTALLALLIPICATFFAWKMTSEIAFRNSRTAFQALTEESELALAHRLASFRQSLDSGAALFSASEIVTAEEWHTYMQVLDIGRTLPGINGIGFIEAVMRTDLDALVAEYAELGVPNLVVHPDTGADELFVIVYVEPIEPNAEASGLDIAFERNRYEAAVHARDTGRATITRPISLVQEDHGAPGFLILRPLYRHGAALDSVEARRAAFQGWVYAPFLAERLIARLTGEQGRDFGIRVYEGVIEDPDALIHSVGQEPRQGRQAAFRVTRSIPVLERIWTVTWESTPSFEAASTGTEPILVLISGLAVSVLFGALLLSHAHRERAVRVIVARKTRAIVAREQENRAIVDSAIVGIVLADETGLIFSVNKAAETIFGVGESDLLSCELREIVDGIDTETLHDLAWQDRSDPTRLPNLFTARRSDGTLRHLDLQVNGWATEHGAVRFTAVIRDATAERKAIDALSEAERRWDSALKGANIGVYDIDLRTGKSIVSDTWKTLAGFDAGDEIDAQAEFLARVHPDDLPVIEAADRAAIEGRTAHTVSEFRFHAKGGSTIWLRSHGFVAERAPDGTAMRLVGTQMDITSLKLATAELQASEEKFRSAVENAPVGMALVDRNFTVTSVNAELARFLGLRQADILNRDCRSFFARSARSGPVGHLEQCMLDGGATTYQGEHRFLHAEGHAVWGLMNLARINDRNGEPELLIAHVLDITDRREVDRLKSEFVATISHELRTPLTSIRGSIGLLKEAIDDGNSDRARKLVSIGHKNCERLILLINDILDLEKLSSNKYRFELSPERIDILVAHAVEANQAYAEQFGVSLEIAPSTGDPVAEVDSARFQQVLNNLLSNAAKFSPPGGRVTVSVEARGDRLRVCVADRGQGISPEFRPKIFQRFSQEDSSAKRQKGGTGLGLHIARQIMEKMNGTLDFESRFGEGAVFWAELPVYRAPSLAAPEDPDQTATARSEVLHIDQDADFRQTLAGAIGAAAKVTPAASLDEALHRLAGRSFDLIVLDADTLDAGTGDGLDTGLLAGQDAPVVMVTSRRVPHGNARAARTFVKSRDQESRIAESILELLAEAPGGASPASDFAATHDASASSVGGTILGPE